MIAAETVVPKKLKIKFSSQRIEAVSAIKTCESVCNMSEKCHSQTYDTKNMKWKPTLHGSNKHGLLGVVELQPEKKQKLDRSVKHQCASLLKSLTSHPSGWAFREPVDPVALNIPDYFSIILNPMDLGTIRSKLEKNLYFGTEEFAADVRLTFSNAMLYNPPTNYVHKMADTLKGVFETRWKSLEEKWNHETSKSDGGKFSSVRPKETSDTSQNYPETPPLRNAVLPKRSKLSDNKAISSSSNVKLSKTVEICISKALEHNSFKGIGSGGRHACGPVNFKPSWSPVAGKCSTCGGSGCQCYLNGDSAHASSDISSERSSGRDHHSCSTDISKLDFERKSLLTSQMSKSDPDSDGAVSDLDDENVCPSSHSVTSATDATSREGWRPPVFDVQLSPTKALRAAILKHRFADTILKAQHKTLLDHVDTADTVKMRQEKERLERRQREEKAWIEAQIRAAEAASRKREELELKKQREKEREAARVALQKMEKTAEIEQNLEILKELEKLSGGSLSYSFSFRGKGAVELEKREIEGAHFGSPLERLGLFIKDDIGDVDEILNGEEEEGEIF